eukprot:GHVP01038109.1.p1 GENE.GHVP01038109.1~~GHVP01038109.1.p1  ORF type:complete len:109 (+),score=28.73 GHVP01038109.1:81-407(+)
METSTREITKILENYSVSRIKEKLQSEECELFSATSPLDKLVRHQMRESRTIKRNFLERLLEKHLEVCTRENEEAENLTEKKEILENPDSANLPSQENHAFYQKHTRL